MGVPHSYTIGTRHVVHASDNFSGMLGEAAIESAEKAGVRCGHPGCNLRYKEHQQALAIGCKIKDNEPLKAYLESIKDMCEADGFAGFVLVDCTGESDD